MRSELGHWTSGPGIFQFSLPLQLFFDGTIRHAQKTDFRRVELRAILHSSSKVKQQCPGKGDDGGLTRSVEAFRQKATISLLSREAS